MIKGFLQWLDYDWGYGYGSDYGFVFGYGYGYGDGGGIYTSYFKYKEERDGLGLRPSLQQEDNDGLQD